MPAEIWNNGQCRTAEVASPWPMKVELRTTRCSNCKYEICLTFRDTFKQPCVWAPWFEGQNYIRNLKLGQMQTSRIPQGQPLSIIWCWHPMHDCTGYLGKIREHVRRLIQERNRLGEAVLIVQPEEMDRFTARGADEWWLVKPEGMRDTFDPYPSVLVEHGLYHSHSPRRELIKHVFHFSPAAFLPAEDYVPVGDPAEMSKQWTIIRRAQVEVQVLKEMS